jgi:hypothetical protein
MKNDFDPAELNYESIDFDPEELDDEPQEEAPETAEELSARDSVYGEIREALIARGIPSKEIAFIHDHPTPVMKSKLFADVNAGKIRVLIGSTEKMGTGANFQERLIALHHLTPCYRPADIQQRNGRILRQGNIFPEVHILVYVTEPSFDAFMWGLVETKARFINQIMAGEVTARTAEDVDEVVLTYAQIKALASGNPRILERVATEIELTKLERLYSAWVASRQRLKHQMDALPSQLNSVTYEIAGHQRAITTRDQNELDGFKVELRKEASSKEGVILNNRSQAGAHLRRLSSILSRDAITKGTMIYRVMGRYRGFEIVARAWGRRDYFHEADHYLQADREGPLYEFNLGESDAGVTQSMDSQLRGIEGKLERALAGKSELEHRSQKITAELSKGWEHTTRYEELRTRLSELNLELTKAGVEVEEPPELSKLDEDAFRPCEPQVNFHQLSSITAEAGETRKENQNPPDVETRTAAESHNPEPATTAGADTGPPPSGGEAEQIRAREEAEDMPGNDTLAQPKEAQDQRAAAAAGGGTQNHSVTKGPARQMAFDWS